MLFFFYRFLFSVSCHTRGSRRQRCQGGPQPIFPNRRRRMDSVPKNPMSWRHAAPARHYWIASCLSLSSRWTEGAVAQLPCNYHEHLRTYTCTQPQGSPESGTQRSQPSTSWDRLRDPLVATAVFCGAVVVAAAAAALFRTSCRVREQSTANARLAILQRSLGNQSRIPWGAATI